MKYAFWVFSAILLAGIPAVYATDEDIGAAIYDPKRTVLIEAQQAEVEGKNKAAARLYNRLAAMVSERDVKAALYLREAYCWKKANKTHMAFERYRETLQQYPLYISYEEVVPRLRELAQAFLDGNGTFFGLRDRESAIGIYKLIILETPATEETAGDRMKLAELLVAAGREEEAVNAYADLLRQQPENDDARLEMAKLLMELSRKSDGDGSRLRAAERHAKIILERNPEYSGKDEVQVLVQEAREQEAGRLLGMAEFYLRKSHCRPEAAKRYINELLLQYQGTAASWKAKRLLDEHPAFKEEGASK